MSECIYRCYICVLMVRLVYCMSSGFHIEGAFPGPGRVFQNWEWAAKLWSVQPVNYKQVNHIVCLTPMASGGGGGHKISEGGFFGTTFADQPIFAV